MVYQNSLDDIIGYVHSFDLFKKPNNIKEIVISVEFVPETIFIKDAMNLLTKKRKCVAVVLDEYGGTSGIVTLDDVLVEIVGDISDDYDDEDLMYSKLDDYNFVFEGVSLFLELN